eukprot:gene2687-895_t
MSQNEFIGVFGEEIRKVLMSQIISCGAYAIMADTIPDVSHADQISLVIRYVDKNFEVNERLMKISQIKGKSGDEFARKVIAMLEDMQLPLAKVLFQCYDTTASMSEAYNGAQVKLKLYNFLTKSSSRFDTLKEKIKELQEELIMENLSKTRWIGRAESIRAVWISYEVIIDTLDAIKDSAVDRDAILTASHLSEKLQSFEFHLSILFMKKIMYKMKIMVLEVQEIEQDILSSRDALCHTRDAILRIRNDEIGLDGILKLAV